MSEFTQYYLYAYIILSVYFIDENEKYIGTKISCVKEETKFFIEI